LIKVIPIDNREIEYAPEEIFNAVTEHWHKKVDINAIVNSFYKGHKLEPERFERYIEVFGGMAWVFLKRGCGLFLFPA